MNKQEYIGNLMKRKASEGYYKIPLDIINEVWDLAFDEGMKYAGEVSGGTDCGKRFL